MVQVSRLFFHDRHAYHAAHVRAVRSAGRATPGHPGWPCLANRARCWSYPASAHEDQERRQPRGWHAPLDARGFGAGARSFGRRSTRRGRTHERTASAGTVDTAASGQAADQADRIRFRRGAESRRPSARRGVGSLRRSAVTASQAADNRSSAIFRGLVTGMGKALSLPISRAEHRMARRSPSGSFSRVRYFVVRRADTSGTLSFSPMKPQRSTFRPMANLSYWARVYLCCFPPLEV